MTSSRPDNSFSLVFLSEPALNAHNWRNREMFMHAVDANDICYAVRLFTTSYDPSICSVEEYLEQSLSQADTKCREISFGSCNVRQNPNITECNKSTMSPTMYDSIVNFLKFGKWHVIHHAPCIKMDFESIFLSFPHRERHQETSRACEKIASS